MRLLQDWMAGAQRPLTRIGAGLRAHPYAAVLLAVLATFLLRYGLGPWLGDRSAFVFFVPAVMAASWYGGARAGVLATFASLLLVYFFFLPYPFALRFDNPVDAALLAMYGLISLLIVAATTLARQSWEIRLRESEERFRRLVELSPDAVVVHDGVRIVFANEATLKLYGAARVEQILGRPPTDLVAVEAQPRARERIADLLSGRVDVVPRLEQQGVRLDGSRFETEVTAARVPWRGRPAVEVVLRDITERKRAEQALRESEARFSRLTHSGLIGIITTDLSCHLYEVNQAFAEMTKFSQEELIAGPWNWKTLTPPEYHAVDQQAAEQLRQTGVCQPYEKAFYCKDGGRVHVLLGATRLSENSDRCVVFVLDITSRERSEALRAGQNRVLNYMTTGKPLKEVLAALIETVEQQRPGMVGSVLVLDENRRLRHAAASGLPAEYVAAIDGLEIGPAVGSCGTAAFTGQRVIVEDIATDPRWEPARDLAARHQLRACWSHPIYSSDNRVLGTFALYYRERRRPDKLELELIESSAHLAGLAIEHDRDERDLREAKESAERAKESAERANQSKDQFLAVLSHELRTPLTPALAAANLLEQAAGLPTQLHEDLTLIRRNIELEARLIDDLLDLTRITQGKLELRLEEFDVRQVLRQAVQICEADLKGKRIEFSMEAEAGGFKVRADRTRLQQVFWNLLINAIKFTPEGGRIAVRCRPDGDQQVSVEVSDTGVGIAPDLLPHVFNAFEQGGRSTTRQFGGLGLGLAICRAVVEAHGGAISVQSPGVGQGTLLRVILPAAPPAVATPDSEKRKLAPPPAAPSARKPKVLLVEDHPDTAHVVSRVLNSHGHEVRVAHTIAAALELSQHEPFDVLVSDLGLPDGSGLELMSQLRASAHPLKGIALSGYGMEEDTRRSLAAGFSEHLVKPLNMRELEAAIDRVVDGERG